MIPLSAESINVRSEYTVRAIDSLTVDFETDSGVEYRVNFMEDYSIWENNAYQVVVINKNSKSSPNDEKLKQTLVAIIEEFFAENPSILLYICETGDGKQAARSRLFVHWFKNYEGAERIYFEDVEIVSEGISNYAALIVERNNPDIENIIITFKSAIEALSEKPE